MKVGQIVAGLHPAAGTTYYVLRLANALARCGIESQIHTLRPVPENAIACGDIVGYCRFPVLRRLGISRAMRRGLSAASVDAFHNHGVWMAPNIYAGAAARERGIPLVFSPHGMFTEWAMARSRRRKRVVWRCLGQRRAAEQATCFHATTESEAEDIRRLGLRQPIAMVPYGVDIPAHLPKPDPKGRVRRILFLSRIHPKKGVPLLLRVWARMEPVSPDWELVVAGPEEAGHLAEVTALARELGLRRVSFPGPAYLEEKSALYRSADLFVLPSYSENFGLVVAESLAHSLPVITTTGTPWEGLRRHGCGWWIDLSEAGLLETLQAAMALPEDLRRRMGDRGRLWIQEAYGWPRIAEEMRRVYKWAQADGPPPSCVVTD